MESSNYEVQVEDSKAVGLLQLIDFERESMGSIANVAKVYRGADQVIEQDKREAQTDLAMVHSVTNQVME